MCFYSEFILMQLLCISLKINFIDFLILIKEMIKSNQNQMKHNKRDDMGCKTGLFFEKFTRLL